MFSARGGPCFVHGSPPGQVTECLERAGLCVRRVPVEYSSERIHAWLPLVWRTQWVFIAKKWDRGADQQQLREKRERKRVKGATVKWSRE